MTNSANLRWVKPPNIADRDIASYMKLRQIFIVAVPDKYETVRFTGDIYTSIQEALNSARCLESRYREYEKGSLLVIRVSDGEIIDRNSFLKDGENYNKTEI